MLLCRTKKFILYSTLPQHHYVIFVSSNINKARAVKYINFLRIHPQSNVQSTTSSTRNSHKLFTQSFDRRGELQIDVPSDRLSPGKHGIRIVQSNVNEFEPITASTSQLIHTRLGPHRLSGTYSEF